MVQRRDRISSNEPDGLLEVLSSAEMRQRQRTLLTSLSTAGRDTDAPRRKHYFCDTALHRPPTDLAPRISTSVNRSSAVHSGKSTFNWLSVRLSVNRYCCASGFCRRSVINALTIRPLRASGVHLVQDRSKVGAEGVARSSSVISRTRGARGLPALVSCSNVFALCRRSFAFLLQTLRSQLDIENPIGARFRIVWRQRLVSGLAFISATRVIQVSLAGCSPTERPSIDISSGRRLLLP